MPGRRTTSPATRSWTRWPITAEHAGFPPSPSIGASWARSATWRASPETAQRLERLGLKAMPLSDTLDALDELMSSDAVQIGVAEVEWKSLLRSMAARTPARYLGLSATAGAEKRALEPRLGVHDILEADEAALPSLLEAYIRDLLARAMGTSPARIDIQQSLRNLGLDFADRGRSAKPHQYRSRHERSAGEIHARRQQHQCVGCCYVAERLLEGDSPDDKLPGLSVGNGMTPTAESSPLLSGADAADLLERIDELSEEEVDSAT